ncbi:hypothetical protein AB0L57_31255 [Nocardia sp. NPDC052254]|uniref:hypothetical protein n=1 Tax=Nocardia sp. NPDC052254 TaxID=3155681 RepID=UPI003424E1BF
MGLSDRDVTWDRSRQAGPDIWVAVLWGALVTICWAPVAAGLVASVYRFPIPFDGYARGVGDALNAALASVFYLVVGGVFPLALAGALAGFLHARGAVRGSARCLTLIAATGFATACAAALLLALLEYAIGPW